MSKKEYIYIYIYIYIDLFLRIWQPVSRSYTSSLGWGACAPPAKREDIYLNKNVSKSISI